MIILVSDNLIFTVIQLIHCYFMADRGDDLANPNAISLRLQHVIWYSI